MSGKLHSTKFDLKKPDKTIFIFGDNPLIDKWYSNPFFFQKLLKRPLLP